MMIPFIFAIALSGCGTQASANNPAEKKTPAKEDFISIGSGSPDIAVHFETFEDRLTLSDTIIYGEVIDYEMYASEGSGLIFTRETIHVIETLYGEAEEGTDLQLLEMGGYVLVKDVIDAQSTDLQKKIKREDWFGNLSDEEVETKYLGEVPDGYYFPEIGDRAVYCLKHHTNREGVYALTGSYFGKYREMEDGVLALPSMGSSLSDPDKTASEGTISYEELKQKILDAAEQIN